MFLIELLESTHEKWSFLISRGWRLSLHQPTTTSNFRIGIQMLKSKDNVTLNFKQTFYTTELLLFFLEYIVTTKVLWQIKKTTLMSSLVSCLLMSANNQKDDILLQQTWKKGIKQNSKLFLYSILEDFFTA